MLPRKGQPCQPSPVRPELSPVLASALAELAAGNLPSSLSPVLRAALGAALARCGVRPACADDALPLPLSIVVDVCARLPVHQRLLLALVSRAFRALVKEEDLWRVVSLAPDSGVAAAHVGDALLRAVAAKAAGSVVELDVSEWRGLTDAAVLEVVRANACTLRRLRVYESVGYASELDAVVRLLRAAPALESLEADLACLAGVAPGLLANHAPYGALRVRTLKVNGPWAGEAQAMEVARGVAAHVHLECLALVGAPLGGGAAPAMAAVVDAVLARRLTGLRLIDCPLLPPCVPLLSRLLFGGSLTELLLGNGHVPLMVAEVAPLCAALRASKLALFGLKSARLWDGPGGLAVGNAVVAALVGHPTLRTVWLASNASSGWRRAGVGASLARLVTAGAPALTELDVSHCTLSDAGLRPILAAVRASTALRSLDLSWNDVAAGFARDELLPAIAANGSMRTLVADYVHDDGLVAEAGEPPPLAELAQAEALVAARARAGAPAQPE